MTLGNAILLGLVQGFAELLPISSSAHLALAPYFLNFEDPGLAFDVSLHLCTLIAPMLYFRPEWIEMMLSRLRIVRRRRVTTFQQRRTI